MSIGDSTHCHTADRARARCGLYAGAQHTGSEHGFVVSDRVRLERDECAANRRIERVADQGEEGAGQGAVAEGRSAGLSALPAGRLRGADRAKTLGRLGTGPLDQRLREIEHRAKPYAAGRELQPIIEVITTIVQASPGRDHRYRARLSDEQIGRYLKAARKHDAILLLNIQPGRARFIDEVKAYERWLDEPDVGVALDPEWAMGRHQVPGRVFGHTTGAELDRVARYLARIVARDDLPEKIMVYHQLAARIVWRESELQPHKGIVMIKSVDGIGRPAAKIRTYRVVNRTTQSFVHAGFKLFFTEDEKSGRLMRPEEILRLHPRPEYVLYE